MFDNFIFKKYFKVVYYYKFVINEQYINFSWLFLFLFFKIKNHQLKPQKLILFYFI